VDGNLILHPFARRRCGQKEDAVERRHLRVDCFDQGDLEMLQGDRLFPYSFIAAAGANGQNRRRSRPPPRDRRPGGRTCHAMSSPQSILAAFLAAFRRLDLDAMLAYFDAEATAFFPAEHEARRVQGMTDLGAAFAAVIARTRAAGLSSLKLDTQDLTFQEWGDTAVATLHLRGEHLSRRTFVLRRFAAGWHIVHMHASNVPVGKPGEPPK
jgi:ketosteroid isomerase-like protein